MGYVLGVDFGTSFTAAVAYSAGASRGGALGERAGAVPPATFDVSPNPLAASYQLAAGAPFGPVDRLALLAAEGPQARLEHLVTLLEDDLAFCEVRLAMETDGDAPD